MGRFPQLTSVHGWRGGRPIPNAGNTTSIVELYFVVFRLSQDVLLLDDRDTTVTVFVRCPYWR